MACPPITSPAHDFEIKPWWAFRFPNNRVRNPECSRIIASGFIGNLEKAYPGLKERVCDEKGEVRRFVNIYLNDQDIRFAQGKQTAVKDGDEISIIPAIAGGN